MKWFSVKPLSSLSGRPPHGGRGLKLTGMVPTIMRDLGRPPHGGRGLKSNLPIALHCGLLSPSSRRAWIEIVEVYSVSPVTPSPSSRRAWIEIIVRILTVNPGLGRPPHGGRGLKY